MIRIFVFLLLALIPIQGFSQTKLGYGVFDEKYVIELCEKPYAFFDIESMSYYVKGSCIKNHKVTFNDQKNHLVLNKRRLVKGAIELQLVKYNEKNFFVMFGISTLPRAKTGIFGVSIGKYF